MSDKAWAYHSRFLNGAQSTNPAKTRQASLFLLLTFHPSLKSLLIILYYYIPLATPIGYLYLHFLVLRNFV
jgi:hypothetical protein